MHVYQTIVVECFDEGYATLTFNRPQKLNTLSILLRQELGAAVDALEADENIRVLILTGAGRAFCVGLDLDEWTQAGHVAAAAYELDAVATLRRFRGPVIGAINGLTVTGGLELALACDVLIASRDAKFADTHVRVGLLPGWGGSVRLQQRVGLPRAKELALTGRFLGAEEAALWGLVNRIVSSDALLPAAVAMARDMLEGVPQTLVAYKQLLDAEAATWFGHAIEIERQASLASNTGVGREEIDARLAGLRRRKA